ncbi:MAG: type VI secretion system membrane subunit TssM [Candidatus Competibacterales bacterium]
MASPPQNRTLALLVPPIGLTAIGALIWWVLPLGTIWGLPVASPEVRGLLIASVVALFGLYTAGRRWQRRRRDRRLIHALAFDDDDAAHQAAAEQAELQDKFERALGSLNRLAHSRADAIQSLDQMPLYLIIGPPGAGKTTALLNSHLEFPLQQFMGQAKIRGVAGTRNCEWWFTNQAILLDTAGRYTTQDSDAIVDAAAWQGFLELLKRYRPKSPLNGLLVTFSVHDLATLRGDELSAHATQIRERIVELRRILQLPLPVYVLFTKLDLLAGFVEFFNDLDREGRAQAWGFTFPLNQQPDAPSPLTHFEGEFDGLLQSLYDCVTQKLQGERNPRCRDLIYTFPRQFATIKEACQQLLQQIFHPLEAGEHAVVLRGVYFTSGTQEGTPMDRVMGAMARTFGLNHRALTGLSGQGKSYFINKPLSEVVFNEALLAGDHWRSEQRRVWRYRVALVATVVGLAVLAGLSISSYSQNRGYLDNLTGELTALEAALGDLSAEDHQPAAALATLNRARQLLVTATGAAASGVSLGLDQSAKLNASARTAYRRLLDRTLLPRLLLSMEQRLRRSDLDPAELERTLKVYRLWSQPDTLDREAIRAWFAEAWRRDVALTTEAQRSLLDHLDALLERVPVPLTLPLNRPLMERTAQRLASQTPLTE